MIKFLAIIICVAAVFCLFGALSAYVINLISDERYFSAGENRKNNAPDQRTATGRARIDKILTGSSQAHSVR